MRRVLLVLAAALAATACDAVTGGGGKSVLASTCVKEGNDKKACDCMAGEAEKTLDKPVFDAMVLGAQGKDAEADEAMQKLTMEQQFSVVSFAGEVLQKCDLL